MISDRNAILALAIRPPQVTPLDVPGLGTIYLRSMTGADRARHEAAVVQLKASNYVTMRARAFVDSVCDEAGQLLFTEADIPTIDNLNWQILDQVFQTMMRINGVGEAAVEDAAKN